MGLMKSTVSKLRDRDGLEAELLEEPALAVLLLVLGLEHATGRLEELLLGALVGVGVLGEVALERLDHGVLDGVPGGHDVGVVDDLDEGLDAGATLHKLLHLGGALAHGLGDREGRLGDAGDHAVPVWALLATLVIGLKDDGLLASISALQANHDLSVLQEFNHIAA